MDSLFDLRGSDVSGDACAGDCLYAFRNDQPGLCLCRVSDLLPLGAVFGAGDIPTDEVLIASKHQSFFDIIMIVSVVPRPKFIMKKQLSLTPIVGYYAKRIGCVAVDRGKRGQAIKKMVADVKSGSTLPGQLIIFPQGTRVAAGVHMPYKVGTGVLYEQTGQGIVPAATNVGVFWPRRGVYRARGLAVVEFLPRITPGKPIKEVMTELEEVIETASDQLMAEAGFTLPSRAT